MECVVVRGLGDRDGGRERKSVRERERESERRREKGGWRERESPES